MNSVDRLFFSCGKFLGFKQIKLWLATILHDYNFKLLIEKAKGLVICMHTKNVSF